MNPRHSKIFPPAMLGFSSQDSFLYYNFYPMGVFRQGRVFFLWVVLTGVCIGCTVPPPGPLTPANTPPELSNFIFPSMYRAMFLNNNIYYFPGTSVSYRDSEGNLSQLILTFRQGVISSFLIDQVATSSTAGTLALNGFVRNVGIRAWMLSPLVRLR